MYLLDLPPSPSGGQLQAKIVFHSTHRDELMHFIQNIFGDAKLTLENPILKFLDILA